MPDIDLENLPTTKKEAKALGSKYFYPGPCPKGHKEHRYTSSGTCCECDRIRLRSPERRKKMRPIEKKIAEEKKRTGFYRTEEYRRQAKERRDRLSKDPEHRKICREYTRKYRDRNPEKIAEASRKRRATKEAAERARKLERDRYWSNPKKYREKNKIKAKKVKENDPLWSVKCVMRSYYRRALDAAKKKKTEKTFEGLDYSVEDFVDHMEKQFHKGMSWDNHGTLWEVDHITSVSEMVKSGITDPNKINCLSNLRPILKTHNRSKSNKRELLI